VSKGVFFFGPPFWLSDVVGGGGGSEDMGKNVDLFFCCGFRT
jgi:hypothetical protein